jgi:hypothetical protein
MATPTPTSYSIPHGGTARGGRAASVGLPAWVASAALNQWGVVPGLNGTASATAGVMPTKPGDPSAYELNAWCGWAYVPGRGPAAGALGGHTDGSDNRFIIASIFKDNPSWDKLCDSSPTHLNNDGAYEPDGKPVSRHTYYSTLWSSALNRVMLVGMFGTIPNGNTQLTVDGFNLDTNTWDPAGTYPNATGPRAGYPFGVFADENGDLWTNHGANKLIAATKTWANGVNAFAADHVPRDPWAFDSTRNQRFGLCFGDNRGSSLALGVCAATIVGGVQTKNTFNPSAALDQFIAEQPQCLGMVYVPELDAFLAYSGIGTAAGRVYKIPGSTSTVRDMSLFSYDTSGSPPQATHGAGICSRFTYVPELKSIVMMPDARGDVYFMRFA